MFSRCLSGLLLCILPALGAGRVLRVCADPNDLPFSNERGEGFENRLAGMVARDLGAELQFTWWSQRENFVEHSLNEGRCDLWMGVPAELDSVAATTPYYRSTYVFVSRADRKLAIQSLTDPRLEKWRIGIHVVGNGYAPTAQALARRGMGANLVGFSLFGKYGEPNPPAKIIDAVADGRIDVAIVWGPLAGYFAKRQTVPMEIAPVSPEYYLAVPFTYRISMGVRKRDTALKAELDRVIERECPSIQKILADYGVPLVLQGEGKNECVTSGPSASAWLR
jgi:mxaJ protein